jgi:hypothetical protein
VTEWLESREDAALVPVIKAARAEYQGKGGRPWDEVSQEVNQAIAKRNGKR